MDPSPSAPGRHDETTAAVERLYREHGAGVRAICAGLLRDRGEAEDAAQQVFLAAFRALANGTEPRDPGAWLATIARHECWARSRARPLWPVPDAVEAATDRDPSARAIERAELASIWQAIDGLPPAQRSALLLREVRGLSYDELADDLQLSRPSVRSLLLRARRTLHVQLRQGAAALSGASWLDALVRLFAGGSNPTVSAATRAAAVGLGTVAIAGGAVAVPEVASHHRGHAATTVRTPLPALVRPAAPTEAPVAGGHLRREDRRDGGESGRHRGSGGGDDRGRDGRGRDGSGRGGPSSTSDRSGSDRRGGDGGSASSGGPGPSSGSGGGRGRSGSSGSGDGGSGGSDGGGSGHSGGSDDGGGGDG